MNAQHPLHWRTAFQGLSLRAGALFHAHRCYETARAKTMSAGARGGAGREHSERLFRDGSAGNGIQTRGGKMAMGLSTRRPFQQSFVLTKNAKGGNGQGHREVERPGIRADVECGALEERG